MSDAQRAFSQIPQWADVLRPVIGMLHLAPLPGSPRFQLPLPEIVRRALADAAILAECGFHGLMLENFGDSPFFPDRVPAITVAAMTHVATEVRRRFELPLGINVLRNDGRSAIAIAAAVGASFIRVNVLCGARVTDQGIITGVAHDLLRDRAALGAEKIAIWADVEVKHSAPLAPRPIAEEARETAERGGADALIVTGVATGSAPDTSAISTVRAATASTPVILGSGVSAENFAELVSIADGFIVGSALKFDGRAENAVDPARAKSFAEAIRAAR